MSELVKRATPTPVPAVKLDHKITVDLMRDLKAKKVIKCSKESESLLNTKSNFGGSKNLVID